MSAIQNILRKFDEPTTLTWASPYHRAQQGRIRSSDGGIPRGGSAKGVDTHREVPWQSPTRHWGDQPEISTCEDAIHRGWFWKSCLRPQGSRRNPEARCPHRWDRRECGRHGGAMAEDCRWDWMSLPDEPSESLSSHQPSPGSYPEAARIQDCHGQQQRQTGGSCSEVRWLQLLCQCFFFLCRI